jgi:aldehyde:ferredoxin oxidoreductase
MVWEQYRSITGWNTTMDDWNNDLGLKMLSIQRTLLLVGGPDHFWNPDKDDDNPPRWYEPLPTGPYKGKTLDKKEVEDRKKKYYEGLNWDDRGIPTVETLKRLDLMELNKYLKKMRK